MSTSTWGRSPSLDPVDRGRLAADLATHYVHMPRGDGSWGWVEYTDTDISLLLVLADRPDLATPEILEWAEEFASERGIVGVTIFIDDPVERDDEHYGNRTLIELVNLVNDQETAVEEAGIQILPPALCGSTVDAAGG